MNAPLRYRRRWISLLLTAILILPGLTSRAAWYCRDGTPCPPDCPMAHRSAAPAASCCLQKARAMRHAENGSCRGCQEGSCEFVVRSEPGTLSRSGALYRLDSPFAPDPVGGLPAVLCPQPAEDAAPSAFRCAVPPPESSSPVRSPRAPPAFLQG